MKYFQCFYIDTIDCAEVQRFPLITHCILVSSFFMYRYMRIYRCLYFLHPYDSACLFRLSFAKFGSLQTVLSKKRNAGGLSHLYIDKGRPPPLRFREPDLIIEHGGCRRTAHSIFSRNHRDNFHVKFKVTRGQSMLTACFHGNTKEHYILHSDD